MSWGFEATNNKGQVLVSSETRNLHFVGKATLNRVIRQTNMYGGLRHYAYRIESSVTPMPFFSTPTDDYYGVVAVRNVVGSTWEIEVIRSGISSTDPEVYVFCDPRAFAGVTPITNYGMQVFNKDGSLSFDSRYKPLVVEGGGSVYPPANPRAGGPGYLNPQYCGTGDASSSLSSDNANTFTVARVSGKPIYFYPSIAQAQRQASVSVRQEQCTGLDAYGNCVGEKKEEIWTSTYWNFYRGGIRHAGDIMACGWITVDWGCNWTYQKQKQLIGIGIAGGSGSGGTWPYSNETLNLTPAAVIIADGNKYD